MKDYAIVTVNAITGERRYICHCKGMAASRRKVERLKQAVLIATNQHKYSNIYIVEDKPKRNCFCFSVDDDEFVKDVHQCELTAGDVEKINEIYDEPEI